jgi:4-amino-4-deoxy-L-arabinose transferase-like glycosyltransferase
MKEASSRLPILIGLGAVWALRILYCLFMGQPFPEGDGISYYYYSLAILEKPDWLNNINFVGASRAPGYPVFLATIIYMFGQKDLIAVYIIQAAISTYTVFYVYKFAKELFNQSVALLAYFWAALYPYYFYYAGTINRETMVFFLLLYVFYHLIHITGGTDRFLVFREKSFWKAIVAYSLLIHTDPRYLFYLPFLVIVLMVQDGPRVRVKRAFNFVLCVVIFMSPWTVRNWIAYDSFVLINERTLDMRKDNNVPKVRKAYSVIGDSSVNCCISNKDFPSDEEIESIKLGLNYRNRPDGELDAIRNDRLPTKKEIERRWYNFKLLWRPYHFVNEYRPWPDCRFDPKYSLNDFGLPKLLTYGSLLPFMIFSMVYILFKRIKKLYILIFPIVIQTLLHVLMWANGRYRVPVDTFVIILACYGITVIYSMFFSRRKNEN